MLMLAYCAGLRGGEIARLRLGDVDLRQETIDIRETKFFKHRRLPLAPGVMAALKHYLSRASRCGCPDESGEPPVLESAAKPRLLRRRRAARADGRTATRGREAGTRRSRSTNP